MGLFAALVAGLLLIACFLEAGHRHRATLYFMGILALHVVLLACDATLWAVSGTPGSEAPVAALALHRARSCLTYQRSTAGAGGLMRHWDATLRRSRRCRSGCRGVSFARPAHAPRALFRQAMGM